MKKKKSPMQLSLQLLRDEGCRVGIVERRLPIPGKFVTVDLWGFADIIFVNPVRKIAGLVQTTTASNLAARVQTGRREMNAADRGDRVVDEHHAAVRDEAAHRSAAKHLYGDAVALFLAQ